MSPSANEITAAAGRPIATLGGPLNLRLRRLQLHLFQHRAAEETVGIAQRFEHFEVVITLANQERNGLACCFNRRREITILALELGRFQCSMSDDDGSHQLVEMALR